MVIIEMDVNRIQDFQAAGLTLILVELFLHHVDNCIILSNHILLPDAHLCVQALHLTPCNNVVCLFIAGRRYLMNCKHGR